MHHTLTYPVQSGGRLFTRGNVRGYCFGFNGQMKDDEVYGEGNAYSFTYRVYDPRIGRFLSVDPLTKYYPYYTPYQFAGNKPIHSVDVDGLEDAKFDALERNDWKTARQLYPNDIDKQFAYVHNNQKHRAYGGLLGAGILVTIYTGGRAAPILQRLAVNLGVFISTPQGQQMAAEIGGFTIELFNPSTETIYNSPGIGNEMGTFLKNVFRGIDLSKLNSIAKNFDITKVIYTTGKGEKKIVIGQGMDRVRAFANEIGADYFKPSKEAIEEFDLLKKGGVRLSDEALKETKMYKENLEWITKKKNEGYDILDIGSDASGKNSSFYNMEKSTIYGK